MDEVQPESPANVIELRGRVSGDPVVRELPSGDMLLTFRLVVPREASPMTRSSKQVSDWVECSVWGGRVRSSAAGWHDGDVVEVRGALRRRYFRATGSVAGTRVEVEVLAGKVLKRAAPTHARESPRAESL